MIYSLFIIVAGLIFAALCTCQKRTPAEMAAIMTNANKNIHPDNGVR